MSDEKMVTEREAVQRERNAFVKGAWQASVDQFSARMSQKDSGMYRYDFREGMTTAHDDAWRVVMVPGAAGQAAQRQYPMPNVTRPRVVKDPHASGAVWRYVDVLMVRAASDLYFSPVGSHDVWYHPTKERVAMWADLFANPTEEVDADADA